MKKFVSFREAVPAISILRGQGLRRVSMRHARVRNAVYLSGIEDESKKADCQSAAAYQAALHGRGFTSGVSQQIRYHGRYRRRPQKTMACATMLHKFSLRQATSLQSTRRVRCRSQPEIRSWSHPQN